ncbi:Uncharacterised protein [Shewanella morhuae]|uniref:Uncharacterized protein n=1 Tax=Shewanella morhuae TaxID=365591 RepID=A0A380B5W4_9GAMM|nr:Uncharacterised protein [Shewanella morhuae]
MPFNKALNYAHFVRRTVKSYAFAYPLANRYTLERNHANYH